jgi:exopolyphosphatase / guanosine-5'-triphosphate,3'-diphosphate pyrophosphatase
VLLRLSVLLCRSRKSAPRVACEARAAALELQFEPDWLEDHPLTRADLEEEVQLLAKLGLTLSFA